MANINNINSKLTLADSPEKAAEECNICTEHVWKCGYLLWRILYSCAFLCHFTLLGEGPWLLPSNDKEPVAQQLGLCPDHEDGKISLDGVGIDAGDLLALLVDKGQNQVVSVYKLYFHLQVSYWASATIISQRPDTLEIKMPSTNISIPVKDLNI